MPKPDFVYERRVAFADTDAAGIVHFSNYFRYVEEAEHAWFRQLGLAPLGREDQVWYGWPRHEAACEYFVPLHFADLVHVQLTLASLRASAISLEARLLLDHRLAALARLTLVYCRIRTGGQMRASLMPDAARQAFENVIASRTS